MKTSPSGSRSSATSLAGLLALLLLTTSPVLADSTSRLLEVEGQKGMWFPIEKARQLLTDVAVLPSVKLELEKTQQRLNLEKERTTLLERNVQTTEQIAVNWKNTAEAQAKLLVTATPWWRNPYLWTTVGFLVGAGATIGIAAAIRNGAN